MRMLMTAAVALCVGLLLMTSANFAQDKKEQKKEVVLKGLVACNKCELGKSTKCETVLVVKDEKSKKDIVYFFDKESHGKFLKQFGGHIRVAEERVEMIPGEDDVGAALLDRDPGSPQVAVVHVLLRDRHSDSNGHRHSSRSTTMPPRPYCSRRSSRSTRFR